MITPEAESDVERIDDWWRDNRPAAPRLFLEELADAFAALREEPYLGRTYRGGQIAGVRRYLLRATRHHVYYVLHAGSLWVLTVWSAVGAHGPDLKTP